MREDIPEDYLPVIGEELFSKFKIGDLVRYCADDLVKVKTGVVLDMYSIPLSSRMFPHALIYVFGEDKSEEVLLGNLTFVDKV